MSRKKLYKYLILALASSTLFPVTRVLAGSLTLGMELGYEKSTQHDKSGGGAARIRSRFQQNYFIMNRGSVVHPRILPYTANFLYGKANVTDLGRSFNIVDRSFGLNTTVLPTLRFPVRFVYRRSDTRNGSGRGTLNTSDTLGARWHLGFKKFPKTELFYNYNTTDNNGSKRESSDYGFTLSKAADSDLRYGKTVYTFSYRGKGAGLSRSVNNADSKRGQLTNTVTFSSGTSFSKRSSFDQSLQYEIRESVEKQSEEDFGVRDSTGSKLIRYSGGLKLATNPYLKQNYNFGYSFDSGVGRPDTLATSFSGRINKTVSSRLNLVTSAIVTKNSTYLVRPERAVGSGGGVSSRASGKVSTEGVRVSGGARWTISQRLSSTYDIFLRRARNTSNILSGERDSRAFGVNANLNYGRKFRVSSLKAGLGGSLSNDTTDGINSKVLSSRASAGLSSNLLKAASMSADYTLTNGKNVDLSPGSSTVPVAVISVTRTKSYGARVSNIWFKKYISLNARLSVSDDKSDSRVAGRTESYRGNASVNYIRNMTIRGTYSNSRRSSGILVDTRSESFGGSFGYVRTVFRGPLSFNFEYSSENDSGGGAPALNRDRRHYKVGYSRRLTRFLAMSANYFRDETTETDITDRIEDLAKLFLSYRLGAWSLSFEWSWESRQGGIDTEEIRYASILSRKITRRF